MFDDRSAGGGASAAGPGCAPVRYLRVSITDRCNLACTYCSPTHPPMVPRDEVLRLEEVAKIVRVAATLGVTKVRVTGGEPLSRPGVETLLAWISGIESLADLAITTNGVLLADKLPALLATRFRRVNVSLDAVDRARFRAITGVDALDRVVAGIDAARAAGLILKMNAVCVPGTTLADAMALARFALDRGIDVRFIETMPVTGAAETAGSCPLQEGLVSALGLAPAGRDGVARMYGAAGAGPRVGFIRPSDEHFCGGCDKLRLSSTGVVRTCLFAADGVSVREAARQDGDDAVREVLAAAMARKAASAGREGSVVASMVGIGG